MRTFLFFESRKEILQALGEVDEIRNLTRLWSLSNFFFFSNTLAPLRRIRRIGVGLKRLRESVETA